MAVCKHCGTEIENGLDYCPNCGQNIGEDYGDFFEPDEGLEEEAYNIFDTPEEFDMDSLLAKEFNRGVTEHSEHSVFSEEEVMQEISQPDELDIAEMFTDIESGAEELDLAQLFGMSEPEEQPIPEAEPEPVLTEESMEPVDSEAGEQDFLALDELFQDLGDEPVEVLQEEPDMVDHGLEELLAVSISDEQEETEGKKKKKEKKAKGEKKSLFKKVFGNVPIDPSKIKEEPTPEQIAAKKEKEAAEKKAKAEEKKLAAEEKKQLAQQNKAEKARQKALAKEEKKAKKMEAAKQILEEMQETRVNRLGATIVFLFFVVCAVVIFFGSGIFGYAIGVANAEKNFNKAYNNNVKYYTDAYNDIYGLEVRPEDQVLSDKIMTVMFVNKQLNSYNSYMILGDYQAALHSLLMGLYRYGAYYEKAIPLGIERDMDFVRTQILKELEATFDVSEDEAELLRSMLEQAGAGGIRENSTVNKDAAKAYNLELYEIIKESGLK